MFKDIFPPYFRLFLSSLLSNYVNLVVYIFFRFFFNHLFIFFIIFLSYFDNKETPIKMSCITRFRSI